MTTLTRQEARALFTARKPAKYRNVRTMADGEMFDSKGELAHWNLLLLRQERGEISDLKRQVSYTLCEPVRLPGERRASGVKLRVDYQYIEGGVLKLEDWKGHETALSRVKRRLMKAIHGLDVTVVGAKPYGARKARGRVG